MSTLMKGGEPFYFPGGKVGCLLIHGFTATPQDMRPLGEHLAGLGHTVLAIRLFAHATALDDMRRARWKDWLASAEDGYHLIRENCEQIVLVGLSLGGVLSLILSTRVQSSGVVAMATPYDLPPDWRIQILRPALRPLSVLWRYKAKGPPRWRDPQVALHRVAYRAYPVRCAPEVDQACREMRRCLPAVTVPVLLIHSREDEFVPPEFMEAIYARLASADKSMLWIDQSDHVVTLDIGRNSVCAAAASFVQRVTQTSL